MRCRKSSYYLPTTYYLLRLRAQAAVEAATISPLSYSLSNRPPWRPPRSRHRLRTILLTYLLTPMQAAVEAEGLFAPWQPSNAPLLVLRTIGREIGETSERFTYTTQGSNPRLAGPTQVCYSRFRALPWTGVLPPPGRGRCRCGWTAAPRVRRRCSQAHCATSAHPARSWRVRPLRVRASRHLLGLGLGLVGTCTSISLKPRPWVLVSHRARSWRVRAPLTRLRLLDERRPSTQGLGLSEMDMHIHAYPQWTRCVLVRVSNPTARLGETLA